MSQTATTVINKIRFLPRIISLGFSSSLEAQVFTWLYVQLHEIRNYNTDSILSIDCVIPKGIQENPLSMH